LINNILKYQITNNDFRELPLMEYTKEQLENFEYDQLVKIHNEIHNIKG